MNDDTQASQELATLVNTPRVLELAGERLELTPLKMRELPEFQRAIKPLVAELRGLDLHAGFTFADIWAAMQDHLEAAMHTVALMARRDPAWVADLDPDAFLTLAGQCFTVNGRFFMTSVLPTWNRELASLFTNLIPAEPAAGSTSPPASSAPATATAT